MHTSAITHLSCKTCAVRLVFVDVRSHRAPVTDDKTAFDPANEPYMQDVRRGQICAFITGHSFFVMETKVTVESVIHFMPGMRIVVVTQAEEVSIFERYGTGSYYKHFGICF